MGKIGRIPRANIKNSIHHVMMRGNNRQKIFHGEEYFNFFLEILSDCAEKFDHKILAYCLMSNHIHLIIKINQAPLAAVMQNINFRYACWVNKKRKYIGHLFQGRYRSLEVQDEEYLINLCRYIHYNPIAGNMVKQVGQYKWDSHNYYISECGPKWFDVKLVIQAIKSKTDLSYKDFIFHDVNREEWKPGLRRLESGEVIVNDMIINASQENSEPIIKNQFLPVEDVLNIVCSNFGIQPNEILGPAKKRDVSKKRFFLASQLLKYSSINIAQIAAFFSRNPATLGRQVNKLASTYEDFFDKKILEKIENEMTKKLKFVNDNA